MKTQKAKHMKRPRAWHHLPNQDRRFRRAVKLLDEALERDVNRTPVSDGTNR